MTSLTSQTFYENHLPPDLVRIPFPERGTPQLVENGAREPGEPAIAS